MLDIDTLIKLNYQKMTRQERKVADNLIKYPRFALEKNISNLALSINVSRNTITRFCKALGFSGYTEFKYEYIKFINRRMRNKATSSNNFIHEIITTYKDKIGEIETKGKLKDNDIKQLANSIVEHKPLKIIGTGKSSPVAQQLKYSLQTLGIYAQIMDSIYYANDFGYLFNNDDVVIVYTVSGHSILTNAVMRGAIEKKANVYMVTTNENIDVPLNALFVLPNVGVDNSFLFSNHTFFYIFNDILCNYVDVLLNNDSF